MTASDRRPQIGAVAAAVFLLVVTAAWWALALWPTSDAPPAWLTRARWVCFNAGPDGLPDASGWLLLIGQPIGMLAVLMSIWGRPLRAGLAAIARTGWGRTAVALGMAAVSVGLAAAAARVADANRASRVVLPGEELPPDTYPRLDRPAPELALADQHGGLVEVDGLRGRPALVTFAFGNCHTVCPAVVGQVKAVQDRLRERAVRGELEPDRVPRLVVVSLDPWRDTPSRLPHLAEHWALGPDGHVLTGGVEDVEATLRRWNVAYERDERTGDVAHPPLVYLLDPDGRIAYASAGGTESMLELMSRI